MSQAQSQTQKIRDTAMLAGPGNSVWGRLAGTHHWGLRRGGLPHQGRLNPRQLLPGGPLRVSVQPPLSARWLLARVGDRESPRTALREWLPPKSAVGGPTADPSHPGQAASCQPPSCAGSPALSGHTSNSPESLGVCSLYLALFLSCQYFQ